MTHRGEILVAKRVAGTLFAIVLASTLAQYQAWSQPNFTASLLNRSVGHDTLYYEIYLVRTGADSIYLGPSDFAVTFNSGNFTNPSVLVIQGGDPGGKIETFYAALPALPQANIAMLNLGAPTFGNETQFNARVQVVSNVAPGTFIARMAISGITTPSGTAGLAWHLGGFNPTLIQSYAHHSPDFNLSEITQYGAFPTPDPDIALPVQLSAFNASAAGSQVILTWTTISEKNNYGFEVQKSLNLAKDYQTIPNSFVKGHGTTLQPHTYTYTVTATVAGNWYYRLKQVDLDGTTTYTEGIQVGGSVKPVPKDFALDQNYPNPFNPTTTISYAVPKDSRVTLEVYNVIGQRVALLVDEFKEAGYYTVPFDGRAYASGIYFYRMVTPEVNFLKKMMVVK